jgi:hypothetical protein
MFPIEKSLSLGLHIDIYKEIQKHSPDESLLVKLNYVTSIF